MVKQKVNNKRKNRKKGKRLISACILIENGQNSART